MPCSRVARGVAGGVAETKSGEATSVGRLVMPEAQPQAAQDVQGISPSQPPPPARSPHPWHRGCETAAASTPAACAEAVAMEWQPAIRPGPLSPGNAVPANPGPATWRVASSTSRNHRVMPFTSGLQPPSR